MAWKDRSKNSRKEKVVKNFISKVQRKEEEREEMEKTKRLKISKQSLIKLEKRIGKRWTDGPTVLTMS